MIDSKFFKGVSSERVLDSFVLCLGNVSSVFWGTMPAPVGLVRTV